MSNELIIWAAAMLILVFFPRPKKLVSVGLPMMYLSVLSVNHWFGALISSLPWYQDADYEFVQAGFRESLHGVLAFVVASAVVAPLVYSRLRARWFVGRKLLPNQRLPVVHVLTGAVFYFLLWPLLGGVASVRTLAYSGWWLMIAGLCLISWKAWQYNRRRALLRWLMLALVFPLLTTVGQGFLGYGITAMMIVMSFAGSFYRPRWKVLVGALLSIYLGLSLFVTYLRDREELRRIVWEERESFGVRLLYIQHMITDFELFDLHNEEHLWRINARLNQNVLVGEAIDYIGNGNESFAQGSTIRDAFAAMVPRIIWPDKPMAAGSGDLVSQYTGQEFAEGTSVGIGHVMELYVNYGSTGILVGFFLLGMVLSLFDFSAGNHLRKGDWPGFVFWLLPGMGFSHVGGSFVEMTSTIICSILFCFLVNKFILPEFAGHRPMGKLLTRVRQRVLTPHE